MSAFEDVVFSTTMISKATNVRAFISELLASHECPPYTMNIDQLDGYLRAVAAEPKATAPKEWMPLIFGGEFPCFIDGYSTDSITNALIWLYNSHRAQVLSNSFKLPFSCHYSPDKTDRVKSE